MAAVCWVRQQRGVTLTEQGRVYFEAVARALDGIDAAGRALASTARTPRVIVQLYTALAVDWVAPRIGRFYVAHPNIEVELRASRLTAPESEDVDLLGVMGAAERAGMRQDFVFQGRWAPVCAPELLANAPPLGGPEALSAFPLLSAAPEAHFWRLWFEAAGASPPARGGGQIFESASLADQAARRGAGFAMGNIVTLAEDLAAGRLLAPFAQTIEPLEAYWLICPSHRAEEPAIAAFRSWLIAEMRQSLETHAALIARFHSMPLRAAR